MAPAASKPPYKVANIELADFGRKEIIMAENEMPGKYLIIFVDF